MRILSSPIFKNLSILVSGTVLAQFIVIGFQVLLRRLYDPEVFGAFAVYMSLLGILVTISSIRYEQAIVIPKEDSHAIALMRLSVFVIILYSILILVSIAIFNVSIVKWIGLTEKYINWLWFLPLSMLLFSIYQVVNYFLIRQKRFKLSASNKAVRRGSEGFIQGLSGYLGNSFGLVIGDIIGNLIVLARTINKIRLFKSLQIIPLSEVAYRYKDFPLKNGLPSLMNAISLLLPVLIINRKFDAEVTGYFDLARMVLILPISLVTASLSQVLLQQFAEKRNKKASVKNGALGTFISLSAIAVAFTLVIYFLGPWLFQAVFGGQWHVSGSYAKILVFAFAIKFIISPFNISFTAFEKIGILSIWQVFYFVLIILLAILPFDSMEAFLKFYVMVELISYGIAGIMNLGLIYSYERSLRK